MASLAPASGIDFRIPQFKDRSEGPVTLKLLRRTFVFWGILCLIGIVPTLIGAAPAWQAAGWGLWLPGAGFLAVGGWWMLAFVLTLLLFYASFIAWILAGPVVLPAAIWLGAAALAYAVAEQPVAVWVWGGVPATAIGSALYYFWQDKKKEAATLGLREGRKTYWKQAVEAFASVPVAAPLRAERELTPDDLAAARYIFDMTIREPGDFTGYVRKDPFQFAALRYQLNHMQYPLSILQCMYTPNFHGYLNKAQQFTIDSLVYPEVCGYWKYESMWGNLRWNPDPIDTKDNVMLTGWSAYCLASYSATTGDERYLREGALQFRPFKSNPGKTYPHNLQSFMANLKWNWSSCNTMLYPCEPNFTYNICNIFPLAAAVMVDRLNGTDYVSTVSGTFWRNFRDEFMVADGSFGLVRSNLTGLAFFFLRSAGPFSGPGGIGYWVAGVNPELANTLYALGRFEVLKTDDDGALALPMNPWSVVDPTDYSKNPAYMIGGMLSAMGEVGDEDMKAATFKLCEKIYKRVKTPGVLAYEGVTPASNAYIAGARWNRKGDLYRTIHEGPGEAALRGPLLTDCAYPDVLVARAMSMTGDDLELVLYNGRAAGPQSLKIERLKPNAQYVVQGATEQPLTAGADGTVTLSLVLDGRTAVRFRPA